ncbi:MAG: type IV secretion system DNA-binding domain-containing protein [Colwellia sp.]|nr:type IV secretion system DNA-binding domain-containing protein [Colwellia sp.]
MMGNHIPPSQKRKNWSLILSVFGVAMLFTMSVFCILFWPEVLGPKVGHVKAFGSIIFNICVRGDNQLLYDYRALLESKGLLNKLDSFLVIWLLFSLIISMILTIIITWGKNTFKVDRQIKGGKLVSIGYLAFISTLLKKHYAYLFIHPRKTFTKRDAIGNVFVFGSQGSGKSTFIKYILEQLFTVTKSKVVIFDEKREFIEIYFEKVKAVIMAPWDLRGKVWDIGHDLNSIEKIKQFASQTIPEQEKSRVWADGSREILVGLMQTCAQTNGLSWQNLSLLLSEEPQTWLIDFELYYPPASNFVRGDGATVASFVSTLSAATNWIHSIAKYSDGKTNSLFSFDHWLNDQSSEIDRIIIPSHPEYESIAAPMCNAILAFIEGNVLSRENDEDNDVWLVLDELGSLPVNNSLQRWLSLGRAKGAKTIAGAQSTSQLSDIYGDKQSETILNLFTNHIVFKCGSVGSTSETAAKSLGDIIIERPTKSVLQDGKVNYTWNKITEPLIAKSDVTGLDITTKGVTGFLKMASGNDVYKLTWPFVSSKIIAKPFIPNVFPENNTTSENHKFGRVGSRSKC